MESNRTRRITASATLLFALSAFTLFTYNNCSGNFEGGETSLSSAAVGSGNCTLADPSLRNVNSIDGVTNLINALPKPLTLPCFLENLSRPLKVFSLESTFSAQTSSSPDNPRVFIVKNGVLLSIVPTGDGKNLLEMSTYLSADQSVKGELEFPVQAALPLEAPFDHIRSGAQTSCRFCHLNEVQVSGFSGTAFSSPILRPNPFARIPAASLRDKAINCAVGVDAYRCAIMRAVFVYGQAQDTAFP